MNELGQKFWIWCDDSNNFIRILIFLMFYIIPFGILAWFNIIFSICFGCLMMLWRLVSNYQIRKNHIKKNSKEKNKMLKIKKGIFYYKLIVEKGEPFKASLLQFLFKQKLTESQLKSVNEHNFDTEENLFVKNIQFELNMKGKPSTKEVVFLFQTEMDTSVFNDMVEGYFG